MADRQCKKHVKKKITLSHPRELKGEQEMADQICTKGAISVLIAATDLQHYTGGVVESSSCTGDVNHAVELVGVDPSPVFDAWIVRNSWGDKWGVLPYPPYKRPILGGTRGNAGYVLLAT